MPRINRYEQQTGTPRPSFRPVNFGSGEGIAAVGRALESVANDQLRLKAFERQKAEERAAVWANEQVMSVRSRWLEELPKRQQAASESAEGFAVQTLTEFDTQADELIKQAPTEASRNWLKDRLSQVRLGLQSDALGFEAQRGVEFKVNGLARSIDQARIAAEFRPDEFPTLAAEQLTAIRASGLPEAMQAKLIQEGQVKLGSAAVQGMIRANPYEALKEINDEKTSNLAVRALTFEQRQLLRNQAEAEINRREAEKKASLVEVRQALNDQLADIRAAATAGMPIDNVPSRDALVAAFGQQEGEQRYKQALNFANLAPKLAALHQSSIGEISQTVESFKPKQVEGAADQLALFGIVQQQAQAILRQREQDAGGYLATYSPSVRAAWNAFQEAEGDEMGEAAGEYLNAVRAEKERLGIQSLDVLPASYADALVTRLTRPQGAETLATAMASEFQRWGRSWPEVYRQLSPKLPSAANVIGSGIPAGAADTLALMSQKTDEELKLLIKGGHSLDALRTDVRDELAEFTSTFDGAATKVVVDIHDSVERTAVGYMINGASYEDAIKRAAQDIALGRYTFSEFRGQIYRVPAGLDADVVDEGASHFLRSFAYAGPVEPSPGTSTSELQAQATDNIRLTGYWRTAPDESGLRLYVSRGVVPSGRFKPNGDPIPVQLTWEELEDLARQSATEQYEQMRQQAARRGELSQIPGLR